MKVLITGATGFVGKRLTASLSDQGHEVVVLTRNPQEAQKKISCPVSCFAWDALKEIPSEEAMTGVDAIVHLAGDGVAEGKWTKQKKQQIHDSRVMGTRHLVDAVARYGKGKIHSFILASATGYYGDRGDESLVETSPAGQGFLSDVCQSWEAEGSNLKGVRLCRLRIGVVLGKGKLLGRLLPLFQLGLGGRIGSGKQWMSWVELDELVAIILFLLLHPKAQGVFNAVSPYPVTNREFTRELAKALNKPALLPVPAFVLKAVMGESSALALASQRVIPQRIQELGYEFQTPTLSQAFQKVLAK